MKFLIAIAVLFGAAHAQATTLTCQTQAGETALVTFGQNTAQVTIQGLLGKYTPEMGFSGYTTRGGIYKNWSTSLEVESSVFQTGEGQLWLRYSSLCRAQSRISYPSQRKGKCQSQITGSQRTGITHKGYDSGKRLIQITCNGI